MDAPLVQLLTSKIDSFPKKVTPLNNQVVVTFSIIYHFIVFRKLDLVKNGISANLLIISFKICIFFSFSKNFPYLSYLRYKFRILFVVLAQRHALRLRLMRRLG